MISFLLNDKEIQISDANSTQTVLEWLRDDKRLTGTKEGCGSGDCGACTVVLAELNKSGDALHYRPINSCITFLSALSGKQLITVEHLQDFNKQSQSVSTKQEKFHPVQQAMVDFHGSQCGFCTPGFIMSMFSLYQKQLKSSSTLVRHDINKSLSGNLCRCTGYRPIVEACLQSCNNATPDKFHNQEAETVAKLAALEISSGINGLQIPRCRAELKACVQQTESPVFIAGSTDLGLEVTQKHVQFDNLIALSDVAELNQLHEGESHLIVGATVTYSQLEPLLIKHFPETREWLERLGSQPIRNQGTMGGNVANASPIGDCPPLLLALDAVCVIDDGDHQKSIPISGFFKGYRQTQMGKQQWLSHIEIPYKAPDAQFRVYKVSKRIEDDISAVCAAFYLELDDDKVSKIRTGFGGVAATPVAANELEKQLVGLVWGKSTIELGASILANAFQPISDVRSSASYRNQIVENLWRRFALETIPQSQKVSVRVDHA